MEQAKEPGLSSMPIPFRNHTALLLSAALPFLTPSFRHSVELALKFLEFTETLRLFREFHGLNKPDFPTGHYPGSDTPGAFHMLDLYITDLEGLLASLSSVCTGGEKELIDMFLNLIRARRFYETYGDLLKSQFTDTGGLSSLFSGLNGFGGFDTYPSAPSNLSSMLNEEQKETLELLKSLVSDES